MEKVYLSNLQKVILKHLVHEDFSNDDFPDYSERVLSVALEALEDYGFVYVAWSTGKIARSARLLNKGFAYLDFNPTLENPISKDKIQELTEQNLELQNEHFEYENKIRSMKRTIILWEFISAILGIIGLVFSLLYFLKS